MAWKKANTRKKSYLYKCPYCNGIVYYCGERCSYKYCPRCGEKVENEITKGDYCLSKGLHVCNPKFNADDVADDEFKKNIDKLIEEFSNIYNDSEEEEI